MAVCVSVVCHTVPRGWEKDCFASPQYKWSELHAVPWVFWARMLLRGDMMRLSGGAIVHRAAGPTESSHCLQPYGIV